MVKFKADTESAYSKMLYPKQEKKIDTSNFTIEKEPKYTPFIFVRSYDSKKNKRVLRDYDG